MNTVGSTTGESSMIQPGDVADDVKLLREEAIAQRNRIMVIEEKLSHMEQPQRLYSSMDATTHTEVTDDSDPNQDYMFLSAEKTIPRVRECCYAEFKNRFEPDGKDGHYAVDVLVSGNLLHQEILQEHTLRDKLLERPSVSSPQNYKAKSLSKTVKIANAANNLILQAQSEAKWPRRIRIQSPVLLRALAKVNRERWSSRPRTYYRPFHSIIFQHSRMRDLLNDLEERWKTRSDSGSYTNPDDSDGTDAYDDPDAILDSPGALDCMQAYMAYMDEKIIPDYRRFEHMDVTSNAQVRFSDLWYLFRTGELVCRRVAGEVLGQREFRMAKRIWKTYSVDPMVERQVPITADDKEAQDVALASENTAFDLKCYYVDFNGDEFCVVKKKYSIEPYNGEVPVNSLPIYPLRFGERWVQRMDQSRKRGEALLDAMRARHCSYNGWTLTQSPSGEQTIGADKTRVQQSEHVNSEVMIDFAEAFHQFPQWRPTRASLRQKAMESLTLPENFRIRWWSGPDRGTFLGETTELTPGMSGVPQKQRNKYLMEDPFLATVRENGKQMRPTTEGHLNPEAVILLTERVFAYVFQERKFAQLTVAKIRSSSKTGLALDMLKIPLSIKHAIQGSVLGHLMHKSVERKIDHDWTSLDLIQGKGTGLFILLHGVPGVGKTATAEAIAQANGKPLFKITVGDLGMTPDKLETSLREIFRLASIWDCILLLDEVDTFFSQRSRADTATNKNALVSGELFQNTTWLYIELTLTVHLKLPVFLRVLDYYNGILFLTTNRAGVLDEAFKSRIHYKIYYPDLTREQALDIWKLNIDRVRAIEDQLAKAEKREPLQINERELLEFANRLFNEGVGQKRANRWNGRQIRNAFQVARSLAYYEHGMRKEQAARDQFVATKTDGVELTEALERISGPLVLNVHHFETMEAITASFENYRATIHGGYTDADIALEAEYRNDKYRDHVTEGLQGEYRDAHLRATPGLDSEGVPDGVIATTNDSYIGFAGRFQRSNQQPSETRNEDGPLTGLAIPPNRQPPTSSGFRSRSSSYLSTGGSAPAPCLATNNSPAAQIGSQFPAYPASSPRFGALRDEGTIPSGPDAPGTYAMGTTPRFGGAHQAQNYVGSPRSNGMESNVPGGNFIFNYRSANPYAYGIDNGGVGLRGTSPRTGDGSSMQYARRSQDRDFHEYDSPNSNGPSPSLGHDGSGVVGAIGAHETAGWIAGSAGAQSRVYGTSQYPNDRRTSRSTWRHSPETDLAL
ncbi:hypothetical protein S40288_06974 [Stachybotrys chartarum IBT 40288]|nr:hypothetical protein S40288_06974 [Stachybotrys chartarum IBT 40288]